MENVLYRAVPAFHQALCSWRCVLCPDVVHMHRLWLSITFVTQIQLSYLNNLIVSKRFTQQHNFISIQWQTKWNTVWETTIPLMAAGKGFANLSTYSSSAFASFPLKMIWTAPWEQKGSVSDRPSGRALQVRAWEHCPAYSPRTAPAAGRALGLLAGHWGRWQGTGAPQWEGPGLTLAPITATSAVGQA